MKQAVAAIVLIAGLLVLVLVFGFFNKWMDRGDNAWAYADPPLTQNWTGDASAGGISLKLALRLKRDEFSFFDYGDGDSEDNHRSLSGEAVLCDATGRRQSYAVSGLVRDRHAQRTMLTFSAPPNEMPGLRPERIDLTWDGTAALTGEAQLAHALPGGGTRISSSDPLTGRPVQFRFRTGMDAACALP